MEILSIKKWIESGSGNCTGYGNGSGSGYGDESGRGYGRGMGSGGSSGCGSCLCDGSGESDGGGYGGGTGRGDGSFDGSGFGSGVGRSYSADIKFFCGSPVYYIDGIPTIITAVFGNYAKGYILGKFLTLNPCYIAKQGSCYAHAETLSEAVTAVEVKHLQTCRNMAVKSYEN